MIKSKVDAMAVGTKYQQVKAHVQENRAAYIAGAGGLAVGTISVLLLKGSNTQIVNTAAPVISPVFNNNNSSNVNFAGHMTKIVKCLETGEVWEKVTEAAEAVNAPVSAMSKHLNGHKDHIDGLHYQIIGMGTA